MNLTTGTEQLLQVFIVLAGILLIPVVIGLVVVLFKLAFLIHSTSEFLRMASYELTPLVKELRLIVNHLEHIGKQASTGVQEVSNTLHHTGPALKKGLGQLKVGIGAIFSGISRSFERPV